MRQTIECEKCAGNPPRRTKLDGLFEMTERFLGFPILRGMRCDFCSEPFRDQQLVVALGTWVEGRIPNIPDWHLRYIRQATKPEINQYRQAEASAKEMRNDGEI